MIVSDSHQFVFIHNPKAAGTSVRTALQPFDTRNNFYWGIVFDQASNWNVDKAHLPLHVLGRLFPQDRACLDRYFSFAFCRHPLSRFISAFNERFPQAYQDRQHGKLSLEAYREQLEQYAKNMVAGGLWNPNFTHATPQFPLFFDGRKRVVDLILPIENPSSLLPLLERFLGEAGPPVCEAISGVAQKKNARPLGDKPGELLGSETIALLEDFYRLDYQVLGYDREVSS